MNKNFIDADVDVRAAPQENIDLDIGEAEDQPTDWEFERQKNQAVSQCFEWFETDRVAKMPITAEFDEMYKLFKGDHWSLLDDNGKQLRTPAQKQNHPNAVENITFSLVEGLVAEFSEVKELVDYPTEEGDEPLALVMTDLKEYIAYKNRHDMELIKWLRWFFLYGTGIWETVWDANWKGGRGPNRWEGEIRWRAKHPRSIFPDARCMDSFEDGRRLHDASYYTLEAIEETWPECHDITPDFVSDDIVVSDDLEFTTAESIEDQVLQVNTWYKGSPLILGEDEEDQGSGLHLIQWAGEGTLKYLNHVNYCHYDPGEDTKFPIQGKKCYERERSPWGMGEAYQLKNPQIIVNKTAEMIIEGHLYEAMGQTWYNEGALSEKQKKTVRDKGTLYGMWFEVIDTEGIHREYGKGIPASLQNESSRLQRVMETIVGRFDISQGKTPTNITAFRALDLLAQRAQVRLRSKELTLTSSLEDSGNYINRLINKHYNDRRKYRILGKDDDIPKFGTYDGESMKKAYFFDTNESRPYAEVQAEMMQQGDLPPEQQIVEGEDFEVYSPEFDTKCKVSSSLPTDRIFYMEMAKELFTQQMIDIETFYYVIEQGRFPPWKKILAKLQQQAAQQPPPGGGEISPEQQAAVEQFIEWLKANKPNFLQEIGKMPSGQQVPALIQLMQEMEWTPDQQQALPPGAGGQIIPEQQALPEGPPVPDEANGAAIKQQLQDILEIQKGGQTLPA